MFLQILGIIFALAAIGVVAYFISKTKKPIFKAFTSALSGVAALSAVNLFAAYTGVNIALNFITSFVAVVLSVPGVILLLILRIILQV